MVPKFSSPTKQKSSSGNSKIGKAVQPVLSNKRIVKQDSKGMHEPRNQITKLNSVDMHCPVEPFSASLLIHKKAKSNNVLGPNPFFDNSGSRNLFGTLPSFFHPNPLAGPTSCAQVAQQLALVRMAGSAIELGGGSAAGLEGRRHVLGKRCFQLLNV